MHPQESNEITSANKRLDDPGGTVDQPESELVAGLKRGDEACFAQLVHMYATDAVGCPANGG